MKNNLKPFKLFIIVDEESGRPMSFDIDQLCFCTTDHWEDEHFPVKLYSYSMAHKLITRSQLFKKKNNLTPSKYRLVPVSL